MYPITRGVAVAQPKRTSYQFVEPLPWTVFEEDQQQSDCEDHEVADGSEDVTMWYQSPMW